MDLLKAVLYLNLAAIVVAIGTAFFIAWQSSGSRNLALAVGTLLGSAILFGTQLLFELQSSGSKEWVSGEYTIDRAKPSIRQWKYADHSSLVGFDRPTAEVYASDWLVKTNPTAFAGDRERLTTDFAIFSLVAFLKASQFDWQLERRRFIGSSVGEVGRVHGLSQPGDCLMMDEASLETRLRQSNNLFAEAPLPGMGHICLPPKSSLRITPSGLTISNPFCEVSWTFHSSASVQQFRPPDPNDLPQLPSGGSQFETRLFNWDIETTYFALRSQNREANKYRDWASRLVADTRSWFEGNSSGGWH